MMRQAGPPRIPGNTTVDNHSSAAASRAGTRFTRSSKRADGLPRYSYRPRYPIMLSSVLIARYATAPGSPKIANASNGPAMLSVMFSATDSMAAAAACLSVNPDGSRLTSADIRRRTSPMSPIASIFPMSAATRCSIRTEKVVFSSAATTTT